MLYDPMTDPPYLMRLLSNLRLLCSSVDRFASVMNVEDIPSSACCVPVPASNIPCVLQ